jgi:hypothetical protein
MLAGVTLLGERASGVRRSIPLGKGCSRDTRASQAHAPPPPLHHPGAKFQSGLANTMSARDVWPVPLTETHGRCFSATGRTHGCQEFCHAREEGPPLPCACPRAAESGHQQRNSAGRQLRRQPCPSPHAPCSSSRGSSRRFIECTRDSGPSHALARARSRLASVRDGPLSRGRPIRGSSSGMRRARRRGVCLCGTLRVPRSACPRRELRAGPGQPVVWCMKVCVLLNALFQRPSKGFESPSKTVTGAVLTENPPR